MGDFKSMLPDLKELGTIASKFLKDVRTSVNEIIDDYKKKREAAEQAQATTQPKPAPKTTVEATEPPKAKKSEPATENPPKKDESSDKDQA